MQYAHSVRHHSLEENLTLTLTLIRHHLLEETVSIIAHCEHRDDDATRTHTRQSLYFVVSETMFLECSDATDVSGSNDTASVDCETGGIADVFIEILTPGE